MSVFGIGAVFVGANAVRWWQPVLFFRNMCIWNLCCALVGADAVYWGRLISLFNLRFVLVYGLMLSIANSIQV